MIKLTFIFIGLLAVFGLGACVSDGGGKTDMSPIAGASSFYLNDVELISLKQDALKGDTKAAFRVYQHYEMVKADTVSAFPWLQMAANSNDGHAQYAMGYTLIFATPFKNIQLARFWLNEALHNGSTRAKSLLEELDALEQVPPTGSAPK